MVSLEESCEVIEVIHFSGSTGNISGVAFLYFHVFS